MLVITQGTGYSQMPPGGNARTIMVRLAARDFYNVTSMLPNFNSIPHPDDWNKNKEGASGTPDQTGYSGAVANLTLAQQMQAAGMEWLASVYIDNSLGSGTTILRHRATGYQITAAPYTQGNYPLLLPKGSDFSFDVVYISPNADDAVSQPNFGSYPDTSNGNGAGGIYFGYPVESGFLRMQFTDIVVPPGQWSARNGQTGVWYDYSTTLDIGDGFELVLDDNPFRKAFLIQNDSADGIHVHFAYFGATVSDATSLGLGPGEIYVERGPPLHTNSIRVHVSVDGANVIVKEMQ